MGLEKRQALVVILAMFVVALGVFVVFRPGDQASAGVDLGDPHAWIEHGLDGELLQINATTGEVTARIEVAQPGQQFSAVPHGDGAVVLNTDANSISLVSGQLLSVTSTIPLELTGEQPAEADADELDTSEAPVEPTTPSVFGSPDPAGNVVVVTDEALLTIDPQTSTTTAIALPSRLHSIMQDSDGFVTALSGDFNQVQRLTDRGLSGLVDLADPVGNTGDQRSMVRAGDGVFVIDPSRLSVTEVLSDGSFGLPFCTTSAATGAVTGGSGESDEPIILAYNPTTSTLNVSRPGGGCGDINLGLIGEEFGAPVATGGIAFIPNWSSGRIVVVDIEDEAVVANFPFGSRGVPFDLDVVGSTVWANEPQGPFAAVVSADAITPVPKISTIVAGSNVDIDEQGDGSTLTGGSQDEGGLRILGETGDSVIAAGTDAPQADNGIGTGPEGGDVDVFGDDDQTIFIEPSAVGIAVDTPAPEPVAEPIPDTEPDPVIEDQEPVEDAAEEAPEVIETLIANFSVSSGSAAAGEVLRFTDTSTGSPTSWTWDFGDGTGAQEPNVEKAWPNDGIYVVALTVTNARGNQSTQLAEITVVPKTVLLAPAADFSFDRSTIEVGESVLLTSRTTGEVDLLEWDFGNGESSVGPTAKHTYDAAGTYTVTLTASNSAGQSSTSTKVNVVSGVEPPRAAIGNVPTSVVQGQFVTLTSASLNEPTRLTWDLGDGNAAAGKSVKHSWDLPGTYRVRLTAENSEGSDATFVDITVTKRISPPVSQFTQSTTEVGIGEVVTFTDLSLNNPTKLIWDFGDDTTARGETATKSWSTPGRYRVTLRATNDAGTNRTGVTITVLRPVDAPVANFTAGATFVATDTRVDFRDTSTQNPTGWSWNFGDTGVSSNPNTSHEWAKPGTYTVRLTVSNAGGSSTKEQQIVVKDAPSANFRWEIVEGTTVKFTDTSWDEPKTYAWDFGDGTTSTERSPTHTFPAGAFGVTLVVSNEAGSSAPKTLQVTTVAPPVARPVCTADANRLVCTGGTSARAVGFTWSAPGATANSTPNQPQTVLTFAEAGRYDVTLTVSDAQGVTNAQTIKGPRVTAGPPPPVARPVCEADGARLVCSGDTSARAVTFRWDAAEAVSNSTPNQPSTVFTFPGAGRYDVTLTVTDAAGAIDVKTIRAPRVANGQKPRVQGVEVVAVDGDLVRLRATFDRNPTQWAWVIDGAVLIEGGNTAEPLFRVPANGQYTGEVRATNAFGTDTDPFTFTANGIAAPVADFTWQVVEPGVVRFANTSTAQADATYEWRFAGNPEVLDGNPAGPAVRYRNAGGTFRAVLIVSDANGQNVSRQDVIVPPVEPPDEEAEDD